MHSSLPSSAQGVKKLLKTSKVQILVIFSYSFFRLLCNSFNNSDILIWIAICGVYVAESLFTGLVFTFHYAWGRNFVSGICKLEPEKTYKN